MEENTLINPLREETVTVKFLPKDGSITDKQHMLYGGMAENATRTFTVPIIASTGTLKNVLTNAEKAYFEDALGVNLSVHNKKDNYWENFKVRLTKSDNILDLSNVDDYLKYKVLLANTQFICPSLEDRIEQGTRLRRLDTKICSQCVRRSCGRPETYILGSSMDSYTDAELGSEVGDLLEEISQEIKTLKQEYKPYKS